MAFDINDLDPELFPDDEPLDLRPEGGGSANSQASEGSPPDASVPQAGIPLDAPAPEVETPQEPTVQGTRPAEGALRATAESELNKSWQGGEGAADFLGLDEEMRAPAPQTPQPGIDPGAGTIPLNEPAPSAAAPADDGLFGGNEEQSWLLENNERPLHVPGTPSEQEVLEETGEPALAGAAVGATYVEHRSTGGRGKQIFMIAGLMLVAGAATVVLSPKPAEPSEESARGLEPGRAPLEAPRNRRGGNTELTDPDGPPPTLDRTPLSSAELPSDAELLEELRELAGVVLDGPIRLAEGSTEEGTTIEESGEFAATKEIEVPDRGPFSAFDPNGSAADGPHLSAVDRPFGLPVAGSGISPWETAMRAAEALENREASEPLVAEGAGGDAARASRTTQLLPDSNALLPSVAAHLHRADEEDLANLWPGTEPPLDQIKRPKQLLTPRVGRVRVLIDDDELFEGRLYAVGEGSLWLDTKLGRIALEAQQVQDVMRVMGGDQTPTPGGKGSQNLTGLARVGVRAPGGTIYGKVVKQEGDHVTLIPDIGGRITLDGAEVQSLGSEVRTTIVRLADASEMSR